MEMSLRRLSYGAGSERLCPGKSRRPRKSLNKCWYSAHGHCPSAIGRNSRRYVDTSGATTARGDAGTCKWFVAETLTQLPELSERHSPSKIGGIIE